MNCEICGRETTAATHYYAAFEQTSSTVTQGNQQITTTTEKLKSLQTATVCEECLAKARKKYKWGKVLIITALSALGTAFLLLLFNSKNSQHQQFVNSLIFVPVVAVLVFIITLIAIKPDPDVMLASWVKQKKLKINTEKWITLNPEFYRNPKTGEIDLATFQNKSGLKTNIALLPFAALSKAKTEEEALIMLYLLACPKDENGNPITNDNQPKVNLSKEVQKVILKKE